MSSSNFNLSRRRFGQLSLAALGTAGLAGCSTADSALTAAQPSQAQNQLSKIGIQLYTLRETYFEDPVGTLSMVKAAGYDEVELLGMVDIAAPLNDLGLTAPAMHAGIDQLENELPAIVAYAQSVGSTYVVLPYVSEAYRTAEGYAAVAKTCDTAAAELAKEGLKFAYHNHDFEFFPLGETNGFEILTAQTDPELVGLELDFHWVARAGKDIATVMDQHAGRIWLCHVKDINAAGSDFAIPGDGVIDFAELFAKADTAGLEHFFVEHDSLKREAYEASINRAYQYLSDLRF
ncbi:MAG: sugar phosphate isomerase/epimerase [Henriciella sp.]|nr:sugar phosphate isomerase/epimerase [Henriciella sp.]